MKTEKYELLSWASGLWVILCLWLVPNAWAGIEENVNILSVVPKVFDGVDARDMTKHYLHAQADKAFEKWKAQYEQRTSPEQIAQYQKYLRKKFIEAIGGLPAHTPLNAQVTGIVRREGYRVEKVIFESQPKHYVTAVLFLPEAEEYKPPYPGVLVACGHDNGGKMYVPYQTVGALLALNGMAALVFDPISQGERGQLLDNYRWSSARHSMIDIGTVLLGRSTARFEIWDGMRSIDYLQSRPDIDPKRIGCAGHSGGGTQTSYLMALDDRIVAASPSCYFNRLGRQLETYPGDAEQNIFGQLVFGMDHADYLMMRAPIPVLVCAATHDQFDIHATWESFRYVKRLYTRMGFAERIDILENDAGHNYNHLHREGVVRWMARWLMGKDESITEPDIELLSEEEIQCTPNGQVLGLAGAKSVYDLNRDFGKELAGRRKKLWATTEHAELLNRVRNIAGIRKLTALPAPKVQQFGTIKRWGYQIKKMILKPEDGIYLPVLMFIPQRGTSEGAIVYVHENGKAADAGLGGPIENIVKAGRIVLAVDLRGTGETQQTNNSRHELLFGTDMWDVYSAHVLGRSYVGMRAEDILICAKWLKENQPASRGANIDLIAVGNVGVAALHAVALEPEMFGSVKLTHSLISWSNLIESGRSVNQVINMVYGALTTYDLDDLAASLGKKLTIEEPLDALGRPVVQK